jgi:DnaK suppressor protein
MTSLSSIADLLLALMDASDPRLDNALGRLSPAQGLALLVLTAIERGEAEEARSAYEAMMLYDSVAVGDAEARRVSERLHGDDERIEELHRHSSQPSIGIPCTDPSGGAPPVTIHQNPRTSPGFVSLRRTDMTLSNTQLSQLRANLDRRYASLLDEVRDALEKSENQQYIELIDRVPADVGDQSVGDTLADLNLALIDRHVRELRDIAAARQRLAGGTFGACIDCGAEIDFARLVAYPTAERCLDCQQQRERTYAHEGTPSL